MTPPPQWFQVVSDLAAVGAQIDVTNPDGTRNRWPLARHTRLDDDGVLWLRPITAPAPDGHRFTHDQARRHGLTHTDVTVNDDATVTFVTPAGQTIDIRPITEPHEALLEAFDTFTGWVLDAAEEAELDRLEEDSW